MRAMWHQLRGHEVKVAPTLAPIPAMWRICSCGRRWLS